MRLFFTILLFSGFLTVASHASPVTTKIIPPPEAAKPVWLEVKTFIGSSIKKTEPFTVGPRWRIKWDTKPVRRIGDGSFSVSIYKIGQSAPFSLAANVTGYSEDSTEEYGAGTFYLEMNSDEKYLVTVSQQVSDAVAAKAHQLTNAVMTGDAVAIAALIQHGADPNTVDDTGYSLLDTAALMNRPESIKALIASGAKLELLTGQNETPIFTVIVFGSVDTLKLLVDKGASLTAKEKIFGATPLMMACMMDMTEKVKLLLASGASVYDVDDDGNTAFHYTKKQEVIDLLQAQKDKS